MIRAVLQRSCRLARRRSGNTLPNPIADSELPTWRLHEKRDPVRAPSKEEIVTLLEAAQRHEDIRTAVFMRSSPPQESGGVKRAGWVGSTSIWTTPRSPLMKPSSPPGAVLSSVGQRREHLCAPLPSTAGPRHG
jgi:hypothetical protein